MNRDTVCRHLDALGVRYAVIGGVVIDDIAMRLPLASDLILLKLAAGGPIDQVDIHSLLARRAA